MRKLAYQEYPFPFEVVNLLERSIRNSRDSEALVSVR